MSNTNQPNYQNFSRFHQFQELMRTNPKMYWNPATQMAMHKLAEEHGDEFFRSANPQPRNQDGTFTRTDYSSITSPATSDLDRKEKIEALRRTLEELENLNTLIQENTNEQA